MPAAGKTYAMTDADKPARPHLYVDQDLPLAWHLLDAPAESPCKPADNLAILQYLEARHEIGAPLTGDNHPEAPDLARLEHKLDLVLALLGLMLDRQQPPVPPQRLRLSADEISWAGTLPLSPGQALWLELYLDACPRPLCLPGKLLASGPERIRVGLEPGDSRFRDAFGKWIFRQHRRAIARSRRA